jgi:dTDP-4-amino-4,6-dideoxygalactose transaminase
MVSQDFTQMQVPFVDLQAQHTSIAQEIEEAIGRVLHSTAFILGDEVSQFENAFAAYCGAKHAVGVDSGTSALELALRGYGIGPGDEVITAANTFIASAIAISAVGAAPVLVDIDRHTYNVDVTRIEAAITPRTKAILPVHLYGQPADMSAIQEVASRYDLLVIEDACQAHGAHYKGKRAGTLGQAAAFSFYPAKNLGACGDGGILVTDDDALADRVRMLRNYGQREKYHHEIQGFNCRLDTIQAAILQIKLRHLDEWNSRRAQHAMLYDKLLADSCVVRPVIAEDRDHVWHLYVVRVPDREALRDFMTERGIMTGIHYPIPMHLQPAYQDLGYERGSFPVTEAYASEIVSLPMYPEMPTEFVEYVADAIKDFMAAAGPHDSSHR